MVIQETCNNQEYHEIQGKHIHFYTFNGRGAVSTYKNSKQESVMDFLREIRYRNPFNHILMILDNFPAHRTVNVAMTAEILDIELIFLPPYSPQLNPIEEIWKSIKKVVSRTFMVSQEMMIDTVKTNSLLSQRVNHSAKIGLRPLLTDSPISNDRHYNS